MIGFKDFKFFPAGASTAASTVDAIFLTWVGISVVVISGIFLLIAWFLYKYRHGSSAPRTQIANANNTLEFTWTFIPFVISIGMGVWAARAYLHMYIPPDDADEIYVVAKQWMWKFQHREGQMEVNELHVPLGHPIKLLMTSQDVIHSLFVPAFRIKQDVLPGRYTSVWFQATKVGEYHLFCTQYCGTMHSRMTGTVIVQKPDDYTRWLSGAVHTGSSTGQPNLASMGRELFTSKGCVMCHASGNQQIGPRLEGIYGHTQTLQNGSKVKVDEAYIRESILQPTAKVVQGFKPIMPSFAGQLSEEQVLALIEYIKSLSGKERSSP